MRWIVVLSRDSVRDHSNIVKCVEEHACAMQALAEPWSWESRKHMDPRGQVLGGFRVITFSDTDHSIVMNGDVIVSGDGFLPILMDDIGIGGNSREFHLAGTKLHLGDIVLRFGVITLNSRPLTVMLDFEYRPFGQGLLTPGIVTSTMDLFLDTSYYDRQAAQTLQPADGALSALGHLYGQVLSACAPTEDRSTARLAIEGFPILH